MSLTQFTAAEAANIANGLLDNHMRGQSKSQTIQNKPALEALISGKKTFGGGKDLLTWPVKGIYTSTPQGFNGDDSVSYANPANNKRASIAWYQLHTGISCTHDELKRNGMSITDSSGNGSSKSTHSDSELFQLIDLWKDKLEDLSEGRLRGYSEMLWRDGTADAKKVPGITSFILDDPTAAGQTFGIDRVANTWWRNRVSLLIDSSTATNQNLVNTLQQEYRQLRRYGGNPNKFYCGYLFMDAFEKELRSKGNYTLDGWAKQGSIDASIADIAFKGVMLQYEPMLDQIGRQKYGYWLDMKSIRLRPMEGEWEKTFTPERPPEKYVIYQAIVDTMALCCDQLNANGVYSIL